MVLCGLDPTRKGVVLKFLRELQMINRSRHVLEGATVYPRIVGLRGADLSHADVRDVPLLSADQAQRISRKVPI
jgi:hypothetical protein